MHLGAFALALPITDVKRGFFSVRIDVEADEIVARLQNVQISIRENLTLYAPPAVNCDGERPKGFSRYCSLFGGEELKIQKRRA